MSKSQVYTFDCQALEGCKHSPIYMEMTGKEYRELRRLCHKELKAKGRSHTIKETIPYVMCECGQKATLIKKAPAGWATGNDTHRMMKRRREFAEKGYNKTEALRFYNQS